MMEPKPTILLNLKCFDCGGYLSCPPIYSTADGKAVCGRCQPSEDSYRNIQFEQLAEMFAFPCPHQRDGCRDKVPFLEHKSHSESCEYRQYICPLGRSGHCEWLGPKYKILDHCKQDHSEKVLENPCVLQHKIDKTVIENYLILAYDSLFLIHTKVCLTKKKIYHSVRYIGDSECVSRYNYNLDIENGGNVLNKNGVIAPQGCLTIQEDLSVAVGIGSMLQFLGKFPGTTFKITINKLVESVKCATCNVTLYRSISSNKILHCPDCMNIRTACENQDKGCAHMDIKMKAEKHRRYYCKYNKHCLICKKDIVMNLERHYFVEHKDKVHNAGVDWLAQMKGNLDWCVIQNDFAVLVGAFRSVDSVFKLYICSTLTSEQIGDYECNLVLTNPIIDNTVRKTLDVKYDEIFDWKTEVDKNEFELVYDEDKCNIRIDIKKNYETVV